MVQQKYNFTEDQIIQPVVLDALKESVSQCFTVLDAGGVRYMRKVVITQCGSRR